MKFYKRFFVTHIILKDSASFVNCPGAAPRPANRIRIPIHNRPVSPAAKRLRMPSWISVTTRK